MAILTRAELLEDVQTAIVAVLAGAQEYTIAGRTYKRPDLKTLREYERQLIAEYEQEQNSSGGIRQIRAYPWR